jgi:hypothetical protein
MINSRAKGVRGELNAAQFMQDITDVPWERTAQRWGKGRADLFCPSRPDLKLHVEVKHMQGSYRRLINAAQNHGLTLTKDDIYVAEAQLLPIILEGKLAPSWDRDQPAMHRHMRSIVDKAVEDAQSSVAIVLFREDRSPWCAAWRYEDDDRLIEVLGPLVVGKSHAT